MTAYFEGDQPAEPLLVVPARDGDEVDLDLYTTAQGTMRTPAGIEVPCPAVITPGTAVEPAHVAVTLPLLEHAGLQLLQLQLTGDDRTDTFEVEAIVVQARDGWHTIGSAHLEWDGSATVPDARLWVLLETAKGECLAYAPKLADDVPVPVRYREAQLLHARNRNAAARIDPATGGAGTDGFAAGPFPLDWTVKQLLRPARRLGRVR